MPQLMGYLLLLQIELDSKEQLHSMAVVLFLTVWEIFSPKHRGQNLMYW
jgi:hypothetical protein